LIIFLKLDAFPKERSEIILISNRWHRAEKDFNKGIITYEDYTVLKNRLCFSLISFINSLLLEI
jgi:hypothetical protein